MNALEINNEIERAETFRQSAFSFAETLASRSDETEELRQLPEETVANMKSFGFSRLYQPRKYGEAELPLNVAIDVLSILADDCAPTA